ncbi:mobile mystery protein A [Chitinophaga rupis]|uniref:Mobile mystery protein A n=1 Tax=Chitinophaga rupis TaxID=573321 RepID=A0A1H7P733_9BACT|nr:mobile mystery protein A [Chitinophaga rupis]SEL31620.1 mobile mystery protein A [Chitinophaga rupis]
MKSTNNKLVIRQLDKKLQELQPLKKIMTTFSKGWLNAIRRSLNMSQRQLGNRLSMTPQGVMDIEKREIEGTITLNTLKQFAEALDMQLVYGLIPKEGSLEKMIGIKARQMATKIVMRTSTTMKLEDQENSQERIDQAINELTEEIIRNIPRSLWD